MEITEEHFQEAVSEVLKLYFPDIEELSDCQFKALNNFVHGHDVFAILPTGKKFALYKHRTLCI